MSRNRRRRRRNAQRRKAAPARQPSAADQESSPQTKLQSDLDVGSENSHDTDDRGDITSSMDAQSKLRWVSFASFLIPILLIILAVAGYFYGERIPSEIFITTAGYESFYYEFGKDLRDELASAHPKSQVYYLKSDGSVQNARRLTAEHARLALLQGGAVTGLHDRKLAAVSLLFPEVIHIFVKNKLLREGSPSNLLTGQELEGLLIYAGDEQSGMRKSAVHVMEHYAGLEHEAGQSKGHFVGWLSFYFESLQLTPLQRDLLEAIKKGQSPRQLDETFGDAQTLAGPLVDSGYLLKKEHDSEKNTVQDGGYSQRDQGYVLPKGFFPNQSEIEDLFPDIIIYTTAPSNSKLPSLIKKLLDRREESYSMISIDAEAVARKHAFYSSHSIPVGYYGYLGDGTPIPEIEVETISTTAMLVAREEESPAMIRACLDVLHQERMRIKHPQLLSQQEIRDRLEQIHFHRTARAFYDPFDPGELATYVEAMAGTKDLLVALGAGLFLLWRVKKRFTDRVRSEEFELQQDRLRQYLDETVRLETIQIGTQDAGKLRELLKQVTQVKLDALEELTHEEIQGDRTFSIFLMQCANLISKIQLKIIDVGQENLNAPTRTMSQAKTS